MTDETERQECCDGKVKSAAGREFCFYDIIHAEGTFEKCDFPTYVEMFECCEKLGEGNKSLEFDCKTELPGGGGECETQEECYENYQKGVEAVFEASIM